MHRWPLAIAIVTILAIFSVSCDSEDTTSLPVYNDIPSFSLSDQMGQTFTRDELNGKVALANFIFTNCTQFCTTLTTRMIKMQTILENEDLLGNSVLILSFSVDPNHDTTAILYSYAENHGANHSAWRFLTGSPEVVKKVVMDGFNLSYGQNKEINKHIHKDGSIHIHEYDVFHTNRMVLIDKSGRIRAYYDTTQDWDEDIIINDILNLLR